MKKVIFMKNKGKVENKNDPYILTEEKELQTYSSNEKEIKSISTTSNLNKQIYQREVENKNKKKIVLNMGDFIQDFPEREIMNKIQEKKKNFFVNFLFFISLTLVTAIFCISFRLCSKNTSLNKCISNINISYFTELNIKSLSCAIIFNLLLALIISRFISFYYLIFIFLEFGLLFLINHNNDIYTNGFYFLEKMIYYILFTFVIIFLIILIISYVLMGKNYMQIVFFFFA